MPFSLKYKPLAKPTWRMSDIFRRHFENQRKQGKKQKNQLKI